MQLLSDNSYRKILEEVKKLCGLHVENVKLQLTEKLTLLLAKIMIVMIVLIMAIVAMIFMTIAFAQWIKNFIEPSLAYCIVASFYVLIALIVYILRRKLIIDPIARFISRVILDAPQSEHERAFSASSTTALTNTNSNSKIPVK